MNMINRNILFYLLFFIVILKYFNTPYKIYSTLKFDYKERMTQTYGFCGNESWGFYNHVIEKYNLIISDLVYIEHNKEAVKSAISLGIKTYHYKPQESTDELSQFLLKNM